MLAVKTLRPGFAEVPRRRIQVRQYIANGSCVAHSAPLFGISEVIVNRRLAGISCVLCWPLCLVSRTGFESYTVDPLSIHFFSLSNPTLI